MFPLISISYQIKSQQVKVTPRISGSPSLSSPALHTPCFCLYSHASFFRKESPTFACSEHSCHPLMLCLHVSEDYSCLDGRQSDSERGNRARQGGKGETIPVAPELAAHNAAWPLALPLTRVQFCLEGQGLTSRGHPGKTAGCLQQGNPQIKIEEKKQKQKQNILSPLQPVLCGEARNTRGPQLSGPQLLACLGLPLGTRSCPQGL